MAGLVFAAEGPTPAERFKDAAVVTVIALFLGIPMIGLTTVDQGGALQVSTRWPLLFYFLSVVFVGRFVLRFVFDKLKRRQLARAQSGAAKAPSHAGRGKLLNAIGWLAFGVSVGLPIVYSDNRYVVDTATTVLIYVMLGWGLNVVVGLAGLLDLGYVAFYAVGAYTYALLSTQFGWGFWEALPVAGAVSATFGIVLGWPTLRLRGDYLAIVTLGFGEIVRLFLNNLDQPINLTNGPQGISMIDALHWGSWQASAGVNIGAWYLDAATTFYFIALAVLVGMAALTWRLQHSHIGRAWVALREDELAAAAMGVPRRNTKLLAFALGASLGGLAGGLFAAFQGFVSPESFSLMESIMVLCMVVLGGMGHIAGVITGAILLTLVPEMLRSLTPYLGIGIAPENLRMLVFGAALVLMMILRPQGLWPSPLRAREWRHD